MAKHTKLKAKVTKDINDTSNSRSYKIDEILDITTIRTVTDYYQIVGKTDIDMIPKDSVEIIANGK